LEISGGGAFRACSWAIHLPGSFISIDALDVGTTTAGSGTEDLLHWCGGMEAAFFARGRGWPSTDEKGRIAGGG